ncbi:hypothetical protein [Endothiovibrio diazotrophicus]
MTNQIATVKIGLALVLATLLFGLALGISFGVSEESYKGYIAEGVAAHPTLHDAKSEGKIWRYAQRAHFHAMGISAVTLGLTLALLFTALKPGIKRVASILIGLGGLYPLSWFMMFLLSPSLGRGAAHHHLLTELFTKVGVGGLAAGLLILIYGLFIARAEAD